MSEQDKLRAAVWDAMCRFFYADEMDHESLCELYADEMRPADQAIDALLGDVVATLPVPVEMWVNAEATRYLVTADDGSPVIGALAHPNHDWEHQVCAQLDEDTHYELTISLRKVNNGL